MKKLLILFTLLSLSLSGYSQTTIQRIRRTYQGQPQKGSATRDLSAYPNTTSGDANFVSAVNTGILSVTLTDGTVLPGITSYKNVVILGNSITKYGNGYGYNASTPEKDYVHLLSAKLRTLNSGVQIRTQDQFANGNIADVGYWEANHGNTDGGLTRFAGIAAAKPDLLYISLGENINSETNLSQHLIDLVNYLTAQAPTCPVIIRTSIWAKTGVDNIIQSTAQQKGWIFVDARGISGATAGLENHPNDAAMQTIADRLWAATPKSATVTPTTPTDPGNTGPPTTAYYSNGFGEGSVEQLMQSAPFVPSVDQKGSLPQGNHTMYLDNGTIRFGIGKALGGAIKHLGLSNGGKNWINTNFEQGASNFEGELSPDTGRSGGWSMYGTPGPWAEKGPFFGYYGESGYWTKNSGYDTGYNPVHGGSFFGDRSEITWFERRTVQGYGEVMYCRAVIKMWCLPNEASKSTYHCYWWLEGNNVRYYSIIDNQRTDNQMSYVGMQQEGPFIYTTADLWHHYLYEGDQPGTNGALTTVNKPRPNLGFYDIHNASEGWIASVNDQGNGVILMPQHNTRFMGGQFVDYEGDQNTNNSSYINSAQMMNYDVRQSTAFGGYIYAGNINNFRSWYNANQGNIKRTDFSWTFGTNNTGGWWSGNVPARFINNQYSVKIGQRKNDLGDPTGGQTYRANGSFNSPFGAWKASDINNVCIKAKFGTQTAYRLAWKRSGPDNNSESSRNFTVNNTNNEQTVNLNMSGYSGWYGVIASVKIELADVGQSTNGQEEFVPIYIGKNCPNAVSDWETLILLSIIGGTALRRRRKVLETRQHKPSPRLRLGVGSLATLLLAITLSACHVTHKAPKKEGEWKLYGVPKSKIQKLN